MKYESHPYADLFPMMPREEIEELAKDIDANGQLEPIVIYGGKILDGRNRYAACRLLDTDPVERLFTGKDALAYVTSKNLRRRDLSVGERAAIADKMATMKHGGDRQADQDANLHLAPVTRERAASLLKVSPRSVATMRSIREADPELAEKVAKGEITLNKAKETIKHTEEKEGPEQETSKDTTDTEQKQAKHKPTLPQLLQQAINKLRTEIDLCARKSWVRCDREEVIKQLKQLIKEIQQ